MNTQLLIERRATLLGTFLSYSKLNYIRKVLTFLLISLSLSTYAQSEYIKDWVPLEEAKFHFDVSYAVVKCTPSSAAIVLMNAFDEGGAHPQVGFTLNISDSNGNKAQVTIPLFETKLGDMRIANCDSDENSHLKFDVPKNIDAKTMEIDITYNTGL